MIRIPIEFKVDNMDYVGIFTRQEDGSFWLTCQGYYYGRLTIDDEGWLFTSPKYNWEWKSGFFGNYITAWWDSNWESQNE